jgi:hypothetical protein
MVYGLDDVLVVVPEAKRHRYDIDLPFIRGVSYCLAGSTSVHRSGSVDTYCSDTIRLHLVLSKAYAGYVDPSRRCDSIQKCCDVGAMRELIFAVWERMRRLIAANTEL